MEQIGGAKVAIDTMWTLIAGMLVFFMNLGFAWVESGLCRAKNAVTILAKNFIVFAASSIAFLVLGWGLMFGDGNAFFGTQGLWFVGGADNSPAMADAYKGVYSSINWTGCHCGQSSSSSWSLPERRRRSFPARLPNESNSAPFISLPF